MPTSESQPAGPNSSASGLLQVGLCTLERLTDSTFQHFVYTSAHAERPSHRIAGLFQFATNLDCPDNFDARTPANVVRMFRLSDPRPHAVADYLAGIAAEAARAGLIPERSFEDAKAKLLRSMIKEALAENGISPEHMNSPLVRLAQKELEREREARIIPPVSICADRVCSNTKPVASPYPKAGLGRLLRKIWKTKLDRNP